AFFYAVVDVGAIARLAQPVLVGLVRLALANRLARGEPLAVFRKLIGATPQHLHEVPAEGTLHRLAHLAIAQSVHGALELRDRVAGGEPAQVAALRRGRVFGV